MNSSSMQGGMNSVISPDENTKPDGSKTLLFVPDIPLRLFKERQQATVAANTFVQEAFAGNIDSDLWQALTQLTQLVLKW